MASLDADGGSTIAEGGRNEENVLRHEDSGEDENEGGGNTGEGFDEEENIPEDSQALDPSRAWSERDLDSLFNAVQSFKGENGVETVALPDFFKIMAGLGPKMEVERTPKACFFKYQSHFLGIVPGRRRTVSKKQKQAKPFFVPPPRTWKHPMDTEDEDTCCAVCGDAVSAEGDEIVFCDKCSVPVHRVCYGISLLPKGKWFCVPCSLGGSGLTTPCALCPAIGGAMKPLDGDAGHSSSSSSAGGGGLGDKRPYVHVTCALFTPEVTFGDAKLSAAQNVPKSLRVRKDLKCIVCKLKGVGAPLQCSLKTCKKSYHVSCAMASASAATSEGLHALLSQGSSPPSSAAAASPSAAAGPAPPPSSFFLCGYNVGSIKGELGVTRTTYCPQHSHTLPNYEKIELCFQSWSDKIIKAGGIIAPPTLPISRGGLEAMQHSEEKQPPAPRSLHSASGGVSSSKGSSSSSKGSNSSSSSSGAGGGGAGSNSGGAGSSSGAGAGRSSFSSSSSSSGAGGGGAVSNIGGAGCSSGAGAGGGGGRGGIGGGGGGGCSHAGGARQSLEILSSLRREDKLNDDLFERLWKDTMEKEVQLAQALSHTAQAEAALAAQRAQTEAALASRGGPASAASGSPPQAASKKRGRPEDAAL